MAVLREIKRRLAAYKAAFIEPCLPTVATAPPRGAAGFMRSSTTAIACRRRRGANGVHLITRNGFDWTERYPSIARAMKALPCKSCIIDGEVVVVDEQGLATFDMLRYGPREKPEAMLYAFDLLELDGEDLRRRPIEARKLKLEEVLSFRPSTTGSKRSFPNRSSRRERHPPSRAPRARRCRGHLPARLRARLRGYRVEAAWLALPFRPIARLDQGQKSGRTWRPPP